MFGSVDTKNWVSVRRQVKDIYGELFPEGDQEFVTRAFRWAEQCFSGQYDDYQPIDARYHDFEHTLQGTLCLARLLHRRALAGAGPSIPQKMFELALLAILFHDTGYLKKKTDREGSGAKYTAVHVNRSATFASEFLSRQGFAESDIAAVQNMIRCTGINANLKAIAFKNDIERLLGAALGTADLLGQMADSAYIEKLPVLYQEFAEATKYDPAHAENLRQFTSAEDLVRKTPGFWRNYVLPRITTDFQRLYTFLNDPYPDGPNPYVKRIEKNISRISAQ